MDDKLEIGKEKQAKNKVMKDYLRLEIQVATLEGFWGEGPYQISKIFSQKNKETGSNEKPLADPKREAAKVMIAFGRLQLRLSELEAIMGMNNSDPDRKWLCIEDDDVPQQTLGWFQSIGRTFMLSIPAFQQRLENLEMLKSSLVGL